MAKDKGKKKNRQPVPDAPDAPPSAMPAQAAPSSEAGGRPAVGREVRRWRQSRSMTLANVASSSGLNVGYLSQIENEKAVPSLDALISIARALDVAPAWLLLSSSPAPRVVRAADRPSIKVAGPGTASEVDGGTNRDLAIMELAAPAGGAVAIDGETGVEHYLVLEGRWRMRQGDQVMDLGPGDYLRWDPSLPHEVRNAGDKNGRLLVVRPRPAAT